MQNNTSWVDSALIDKFNDNYTVDLSPAIFFQRFCVIKTKFILDLYLIQKWQWQLLLCFGKLTCTVAKYDWREDEANFKKQQATNM